MTKLTKDIFAVRPGEIYPEWIKAGEQVPEGLEAAAKDAGALRATKAAKAAPENK